MLTASASGLAVLNLILTNLHKNGAAELQLARKAEGMEGIPLPEQGWTPLQSVQALAAGFVSPQAPG